MRTGEVCCCGRPAAKKIEESILWDDPLPDRHPLTGYVCEVCFAQLLGYAAVTPGVDWRVCMSCQRGYACASTESHMHCRDCRLKRALARVAELEEERACAPHPSGNDGTDRLCAAVYGRPAQVRDYLGGSQARMLHDGADRIEEMRSLLRSLEWSATESVHDEPWCCPCCSVSPGEAHRSACELALAIGARRGSE